MFVLSITVLKVHFVSKQGGREFSAALDDLFNKLVNYATLGILVEDMKSCHIEGNLYLIAGSCLGTRRYTSDEVGLADAEVEINL